MVETSSFSKANMPKYLSKQRRYICQVAGTPVTPHNERMWKHNKGRTDVRVWHSKASLKHKECHRVTETPSVESSGRIRAVTGSDPDKRSGHPLGKKP